MHTKIQTFSTHKDGNEPTEYEDAWKTKKRKAGGKVIRSYAVADGATESAYSREWAQIIVESFVTGDFDLGITEDILEPLRESWKKRLPATSTAWYVEEKLSEGSFAALAGLQLISDDHHQKQGIARLMAVGDCCVMRVRQNELKSFPIEESAQFNSRPQLIGTRVGALSKSAVLRVEWDWKLDDVFLLMSDAIAAWYLEQWELGTERREYILFDNSENTPDEWRHLLRKLMDDGRKDKSLKNDDLTLIHVSVEG